ARGLAWFDPCDERCHWSFNGLCIKVFNETLYGSFSRTVQNESYYNRIGIAYTPIGNRFVARIYRRESIMGKMSSSVFPDDVAFRLWAMNQSLGGNTLTSFNLRTDRSSLSFFRQIIVELRALRTATSSWRSVAARARSTAAHVPDSATRCI